jgi:hypothetical protein
MKTLPIDRVLRKGGLTIMRKKSKITYNEAVHAAQDKIRGIAEKGMFGTQEEAQKAIFTFFKELKNVKLPDSKEQVPDYALDLNDSWSAENYSCFARQIGEFRKYYLEGNYIRSINALENMSRHRVYYLTDGCRAALLEAGRLVLKDDFP